MIVIGIAAVVWGIGLAASSTPEPSGNVLTVAGAVNLLAIGWCCVRPHHAAWFVRWIVQPTFTIALTVFGFFMADVLHGGASQRLQDQLGISMAALFTIAAARVALATAVNDSAKGREEATTQKLQALETSWRTQAADLDSYRAQLQQLRRHQHDLERAGRAGIRRAIVARLFGA